MVLAKTAISQPLCYLHAKAGGGRDDAHGCIMQQQQMLTCAFNIAKLTDQLVSYFIVSGTHFAFHFLTDLVGQSLCE